jgi:uncharacterized phage infection (PIP) family protein YhgE
VNIFDSTRSRSGTLEAPCQTISETISRSFRSFAGKSPSLYTLFCWTLLLSVLLLMVSGCGRYKEELESAKQQIEKLNSDVKRLTEDAARLNEEKNRLSDDSKTLADKNTRMHRELDDLNKAKETLSAENKEIKKKNSATEEEIASLKKEKAQLTQEVKELKKRLDEIAPPQESPPNVPTQIGPPDGRQAEKFSPCDAVLAFMKASEAIVRQQKGTARATSLEQVKKQYAPRMKGAPQKAIKAAENWVKEGSKFWDQVSDDSTYRLLQLRNVVLEACGKSPREAGF